MLEGTLMQVLEKREGPDERDDDRKPRKGAGNAARTRSPHGIDPPSVLFRLALFCIPFAKTIPE